MSKRFLIIMGVLVAVFFGFLFFGKANESANAPTDVNNGSNHVRGESSTGVTLTEFGDFQCPTCGSYYQIVKDLEKEYKGKVAFEFRHFPLVQIHDKAMVAHRAAEAAGKQGKFFQMHDLLYERQQIWTNSSNAKQIMEDYASELGLNVDEFRNDFASSEVNDVINSDVKIGQSKNVSGTPTFFINDKKVEELPRTVKAFSDLIDEAIKEAQQ